MAVKNITDLHVLGNVGIGTTSPGAKLEIDSGAPGSIKLGELSNYNGISLNGTLDIQNYNLLSRSTDKALYINRPSGNDIFFRENNTDTQVVIKSGGNVGIGTTSPSDGLTVATSLRAYGAITPSANGAYLGKYDAGVSIDAGELVLATNGKTGWDEDVDEFGRIRFYSTDGSGIGARDAAVIKAINGFGNGSNTTTFSGELAFFTSTYDANVAEALRIDGSGNVGIGTTSPSQKLQVGAGSADDRIRVYFSDGAYSDQTGFGMEFARNASYLRPNNDNVRTLNIGDPSHTWANVNIDATSLKWNTNTLATQSWVVANTSTPTLDAVTTAGNVTTNNIGVGLIELSGDTEHRLYRATTSLVKGTTTDTTILTGRTLDLYAYDDVNIRAGSGDNISFTAGGVSNAMYINSSGNVGIGTTSPRAKLEVIGENFAVTNSGRSVGGIHIASDSNDGAGTYSGGISFAGPGSGSAGISGVQGTSDGDTQGLAFFTHESGTGANDSSEKMRITSVGNVGIGTTAPTAKLDVISNGVVGRFKSTDSGTGGFAEVYYENDAGDRLITGSIGSGYTNSAWAGARYMYATAGDLMIKTLGSGTNLRFYTAGATNERMRIDGSGNVGIGTTNMYARLNVRATSHNNGISVNRQADTTAALYIGNDGGNNPVLASNNADMLFGRDVSGTFTERMRLTNGGNVGIGTTSPGYTLDVNGSMHSTNITIADAIYHEGDTNTVVGFGTDTINLSTGGGVRATINNSGTKFNNDVVVVGGATLSLGERGEPDDLGRTVLLEGAANAGSGEGAGRIFFSEHNSTTAGADSYGLSLYYEGDPNIALPSGFQPNTGNGTWSLRRHNNSVNGAAIMSGSRTNSDVQFGGSITIGSGVTLSESTDRADLLSVTSSTSGWGGLQITNTAGDGIWSFMVDGAAAGIYDDQNGEWAVYCVENSYVQLRHNGTGKLTTSSSGVDVAGRIYLSANDSHIEFNTSASSGHPKIQMGADADFSFLNTAGSTNLHIENGGKVGIGTTSPAEKLDIAGNVQVGISSGYNRVGFIRNGGSGVGAIGWHSDGNFYIGGHPEHGPSAGNVVRVYGFGSDIRLGDSLNGDVLNIQRSSGNVGIGTTSPSEKLEVSGNILASGDITAFSDARLKENVKTLPNALKSVKAMRGVTYNKIGEEKQSIGVIAQEVQAVLPQLVSEHNDGMLSVAYGNVTAVLIEAIKEQQKQIEELKAQLDGITK